MTLSRQDLEAMLEGETNMRNEVIAWRNRFPAYLFEKRTAMIVENPSYPKCQCEEVDAGGAVGWDNRKCRLHGLNQPSDRDRDAQV